MIAFPEMNVLIDSWAGRRLDTMTRAELIEVVQELYRLNQMFVDGARADREMFGRIMQSARPR